jgi:hypothetical protein
VVLFEEQLLEAGETSESRSMAEWAATAPRSRGRGMSSESMARASREMSRMVASGDWTGAVGKHFVALLAFLHLRIYGIECADLGPTERMHASGAATRMLEREFGGDANAMAEFVRWCWQREQRTEKWRRENRRSGRRLSWRLQFGGQLLTDFRIDRARTRVGSR